MQTNIILSLLLAASAHAACVSLTTTTSTAASVATSSSSATNTTTSTSGTTFGTCSPAMDFQLGRAAFNRKATEGTFLPTDPVVAKGQQDALNPNIITNAICNNLINNCGLKQGDAGETACLSAKAVVASLGTRDATTADAWNKALGV